MLHTAVIHSSHTPYSCHMPYCYYAPYSYHTPYSCHHHSIITIQFSHMHSCHTPHSCHAQLSYSIQLSCSIQLPCTTYICICMPYYGLFSCNPLSLDLWVDITEPTLFWWRSHKVALLPVLRQIMTSQWVMPFPGELIMISRWVIVLPGEPL